jgi:hypothetical protein
MSGAKASMCGAAARHTGSAFQFGPARRADFARPVGEGAAERGVDVER